MSYLPADLPRKAPKRPKGAVASVISAGAVALVATLRLATGEWTGWLAPTVAIIIVGGLVAVMVPVIIKGSTSAWNTAAAGAPGAYIIRGFITPQMAELLTACGHQVPGVEAGTARAVLAVYPQGVQVWAGTPIAPTLTIPWEQTGRVEVGVTYSGTRKMESVAIQTPNDTEISILPMMESGFGALFPSNGRGAAHVEAIRQIRGR